MLKKPLLLGYKAVQLELKRIKELESKLRMEIADELLKHRRIGTHHFDFDNVHVKGVKKLTVTPDTEKLDAHWPKMSAEERSCFKYKPAYVATEYKKLMDTTVVDECLTTKPAMPSIEITISEEE